MIAYMLKDGTAGGAGIPEASLQYCRLVCPLCNQVKQACTRHNTCLTALYCFFLSWTDLALAVMLLQSIIVHCRVMSRHAYGLDFPILARWVIGSGSQVIHADCQEVELYQMLQFPQRGKSKLQQLAWPLEFCWSLVQHIPARVQLCTMQLQCHKARLACSCTAKATVSRHRSIAT